MEGQSVSKELGVEDMDITKKPEDSMASSDVEQGASEKPGDGKPHPDDGEDRPLTYEERAKKDGIRYTITDVPPFPLAVMLGFQHFLTMLGATVLIPLLVTPAMGATPKQTAQVISTIFVVSGINTLIQTSLGDRLPIVQGGSFAFLPPTFSIIANPTLQAIEDPSERFEQTMQVVSGSVLVAGIVQATLGYSGAVVPLLRYISPVTIAPVIAAIGLGLYGAGFNNVSTCFPLGLTQIALSVIFSQYMKRVTVGGWPVFALFPIILAISCTWIFAAILTATDTWTESQCRTDSTRDVMEQMPWIHVPYPGQWHGIQFKAYGIVPMLGSMLVGMIESVGDYYSCARLAGAPPPTPGIISRGLAGEALGLMMSGLFGTGNGTTSYAENIGAIALTRVGSRAVIQCAAIVMILVGLLGKVSALLASMPTAIVGGIYCVVFGLIVAVGLSNLQYVNLNSERNLFIIGFAIFNCLSVAGPSGYFDSQGSVNPFGDSNGGEIALALFGSPMFIALLSAFVLDNTIPASPEDRGLTLWIKVRDADVNNDPEYVRVYSLPLFFAKLFRNCNHLEYLSRGGQYPDPPLNGYQPGVGDIGDYISRWFFGGRQSRPSMERGVSRDEEGEATT